MTVLRANFSSGSVQENPLAAGVTTLTMAGNLQNLPTIGGGNFARLTIDPLGTDGLSGSGTEIVHVTAYTHGAGSATIARGQEGTTDRPHSEGVKIVNAPTAQDWTDVITQHEAESDPHSQYATDTALSAAVASVAAAAVNDGDTAGGVLSGSYPNPGFAQDMATQTELNAVAAAAVLDGDAAGGVLSGTFPSPGFAVDMATQAELDAHTHGLSWQTPTYSNGWNSYSLFDAAWQAPRFAKDSHGCVHIEGTASAGTWANDTVIFVLPSGYRPVKNHMFMVNAYISTGGLASARVDVLSDGSVLLRYATPSTSNVFLQLDGILFGTT